MFSAFTINGKLCNFPFEWQGQMNDACVVPLNSNPELLPSCPDENNIWDACNSNC